MMMMMMMLMMMMPMMIKPDGFVVTIPFDILLMVSFESNQQRQIGTTTIVRLIMMLLLLMLLILMTIPTSPVSDNHFQNLLSLSLLPLWIAFEQQLHSHNESNKPYHHQHHRHPKSLQKQLHFRNLSDRTGKMTSLMLLLGTEKYTN
jgi:hypothetical protein